MAILRVADTLKEMYGDQFGEFVCGYYYLKGFNTVEPPLTATSVQRPLSSLPKVAVVERFECIIILFFSCIFT